jgi:4'-phosphopantetheinyl transferase
MSGPLLLLAAASALPPGDEWLRPRDRALLLRLQAPKRRRDFRLGRYAAGRALAALEGREGAEAQERFEVRPAPGGAPLAFCDSAPLAVTLSISHSEGFAVAGVQPGSGPLGCDLERVEARSPAFVEDYFTRSEQAFVAAGPEGERPWRATLLWSAKEAVMKALGEGLRLPPRAVEVRIAPGPASPAGWRTFSVVHPPAATRLRGSWRASGEFLLAVAGGLEEPRLVETTRAAKA